MPGTDLQTESGGRVHTPAAWRWVLALVVGIALFRVLYLMFLSPYDLAEDEAFYWDWSRHLDWSYYTKGPGIAWAMFASTSLMGTSELAIRLVAVVSGMIGALATAGLTLDVTRGRARAALIAGGLYHLAPGLAATALLSTIDGPYIACWAVAAWAGYRALHARGGAAWLALGAALGAGLLFKYTILLLAAGVAGAMVFGARGGRHRRWRTLAAAALLLLLLGLLPILIWNAQHNWGTVKHLLGHVGSSAGDRAVSAEPWAYDPRWTIEMLGAQIGFVGPMLIAMALGMTRRAGGTLAAGARGYLLWTAAPILVFYFALSLASSGEGNWPLAGFVTLMPLAAAWLDAGLARGPGGWPRLVWRLTLVYGVVAGVGMLRMDLVKAGAEMISPALAKPIPLHRLMGARQMARGVALEVERVREATGQQPMIITSHYGLASQLGFYLPGRPVVRTAMSRLGGRTVQQDFWPDASLDDQSLKGRTALLIGGGKEGKRWMPAFERIEPVRDARGEPRIEGDPRTDRWAFIGYGYRGFPPSAAPTPARAAPDATRAAEPAP